MLSASSAHAQAYPAKPVRIIVPFTPGTGMDILARSVGQKLSERWGQGVVIDNRAGASGNIGNELVAKSPADGHTLMVTANTFVITPALSKSLPFDSARDFTPSFPRARWRLAVTDAKERPSM